MLGSALAKDIEAMGPGSFINLYSPLFVVLRALLKLKEIPGLVLFRASSPLSNAFFSERRFCWKGAWLSSNVDLIVSVRSGEILAVLSALDPFRFKYLHWLSKQSIRQREHGNFRSHFLFLA